MAGPGELPSSTTRRIIRGHILPVDPAQAVAFLKTCHAVDLVSRIAAGRRALENDRPHDAGTYARVKAHKRMLAEQAESDDTALADATVLNAA